MKKFDFQFSSKEMLTREQMKKVTGGYATCNMDGWTAHSENWLEYTDGLESEHKR